MPTTPIDPVDPRTRLAAERTLLAWIRTGLAMMGFGFVVARFGLFLRELAAARGAEVHTYGLSLWIGVTLVTLGVIANLLAAVGHQRLVRRLEQGELPLAPRWPLGIVVATTLGLVGAIMAGYLIFVGV